MTAFAIHRKQTLLLSMVLALIGLSAYIGFHYATSDHSTPNWAGYVLQDTDGVAAVSATWNVPTLNCQITPNGFSTVWVGVGGFGRDAIWPFPQAGTDSNCVNGEQVNDYWCSHQTFKKYVVAPGDMIKTKVFREHQTWFCSVIDVTSKRADEKMMSYKYSGTTRTSEWIVESTTITKFGKSKIGKLADFGRLTFANMKIFPRRLRAFDHESQNDIVMTGPDGRVIASPSWSNRAMTISYK
jgi:hypothetical protein